MNLLRYSTTAIFSSLLLLLGCTNDSDPASGLPSHSGRAGEIIVVCTQAQWDGYTGKAVREVFYEEVYGLPQTETKFTLIQTNRKNFESIFRTYRNIFMVSIDTNRWSDYKLTQRNDVWAKNQLVVEMQAAGVKDFMKGMKENSTALIELYDKKEYERLYKRNRRYGNKKLTKQIFEKYGVRLSLQEDAYAAIQDSNTAWIRVESERPVGGFNHQVSQGILIYDYPYVSESQLSDDFILARRDSMLQAYIPGPSDGSYMTTEYRFLPPKVEETSLNGRYAKVVRNLWKMENNFMGGPMVSVVMVDESRQRVVCATGYVFAPQFDKRELMREVEAVMRTMSFE